MVGHQLYQWINRRFLPFAPVPWKSPGLGFDLLISRFAVALLSRWVGCDRSRNSHNSQNIEAASESLDWRRNMPSSPGTVEITS